LRELEIFLFSVFSSGLAPILGIGGGLLNMPFLTLYLGVSFGVATTASLLSGACLSFSASLHNIRKGKAYVETAIKFLPPVLLGSAISAYIPLQERLLYMLFAVFLLVIAYFMVFDSTRIRIENRGLLVLVLFAIGIASGLFGIGGGLLFVPLLMFTRNLGIKEAVATSSFMVLFVMLMGFASHTLHGDLDPWIAIPLAIPALFMGYFGAYMMVEKIPRETLKKIFSAFLLLVACTMAFRAFA